MNDASAAKACPCADTGRLSSVSRIRCTLRAECCRAARPAQGLDGRPLRSAAIDGPAPLQPPPPASGRRPRLLSQLATYSPATGQLTEHLDSAAGTFASPCPCPAANGGQQPNTVRTVAARALPAAAAVPLPPPRLAATACLPALPGSLHGARCVLDTMLGWGIGRMGPQALPRVLARGACTRDTGPLRRRRGWPDRRPTWFTRSGSEEA